jgi:hypothetical protein
MTARDFVGHPATTRFLTFPIGDMRRPAFSWVSSLRVLLSEAAAIMGVWLKRCRQRRELRAYLMSDHRAAADMRTSESDAQAWTLRPFWMP